MNSPHDYPPIHLGSPGEEISIQDLHTIRHRFKHLSQLREQRIQKSLLPYQHIFMDVLPLLFHCNAPALPGFVSTDTPAGIVGYKATVPATNAAKKLAISFNHTRAASHDHSIEGLFVMGDVGNMTFSKTNSMSIWVFHASGLSATALDDLQKKTVAIESWAASLKLEVHFFLLDSEQFQLGQNPPVSTQHDVHAQHYLILEEFYRKAIYLAGKSPAWWLVPLHEEGNYAGYINHLIDKRFIPEHEIIDLGGFESVPAEELAGATFDRLYKALHSPHKSILELFLMECYGHEYPQIQWPCQDIKKSVYQGDYTLADLDPSFLVYQKVENYLKNIQDFERLDLARQSFYLKVMGPPDHTMTDMIRLTRDKYMQSVAERWNWPASTLEDLKSPLFWNITNAASEHTVILQQLTRSYRAVIAFAKNHASANQTMGDGQKLITRKLQSFLEKKPGKVAINTTHAEVHSKENALSIIEKSLPGNNIGWALYLKYVQASTASDFKPIQHCRTLIEVLCWLVINSLYHKDLQINFSPQSIKMPDLELYSILRQLNLFLTEHFNCDPPLNVYQSISVPLNSLVIINMGIAEDTLVTVMSERSDALSYGKNRECLIHTINRISLSSWGEVTTSQDEGLTGLFNCFTDIINNNKRPLSLKNLKFICHTPKRARCIIFRVEVVFSILVKLFAKQRNNGSPRYILPGGTLFYIFQANNRTLNYKTLSTEQQLLNDLAAPQEHFSEIYFDQTVLGNTPIPHIYTRNKSQVIQLFYYENNADFTVYIIDEKSALYIQHHNKTNAGHLLNQYSVFLESINSRNLHEDSLTIEYYAIEKSSAEVFSCKQVQLKATASNQVLNLRITGEDSQQGIIFTIYCNEDEFSPLTHGNRVFQAVYQHILKTRNNKMDYPVHINDIDLPLSAFGIDIPTQLQTIHYLKYKQKIEDKFNNGILSLTASNKPKASI